MNAVLAIARDFASLTFAEGSTPYLITSIVAMIAIAALFGAVVGVAAVTVWIAFRRAFLLVTGRSFVFTRRMAFILSSIMAAILICAFIFHLYQAIQVGEISTMSGRGRPAPRTVFWSENRGEFIWTAFVIAVGLTSFWTIVGSLLFKAASRSK
jgi:cytochrome b subunit of formate dehydrogenase